MISLEIHSFGVVELDHKTLATIDGGGSWPTSLGYACGYLMGCATNAADMLSSAIKDGLIGKAISGQK